MLAHFKFTSLFFIVFFSIFHTAFADEYKANLVKKIIKIELRIPINNKLYEFQTKYHVKITDNQDQAITSYELSWSEGYCLNKNRLIIIYCHPYTKEESLFYMGTVYEVKNTKLELLYRTKTEKKYKNIHPSESNPVFINKNVILSIQKDLIDQDNNKINNDSKISLSDRKSIVEAAKKYIIEVCKLEKWSDEDKITNIKVYKEWASIELEPKNGINSGFLLIKTNNKWQGIHQGGLSRKNSLHGINKFDFYRLHLTEEIINGLDWYIEK